MSDPLQLLQDWAAPLLQRLAPAARRRLAADIARALRVRQQRRIAEQKDPDGAAFVPRKPRRHLRGKAGRIKRDAMFVKLRTSKYLKTRATENAAVVQFTGRAGQLATVHQYGELDNVTPTGPRVRYPRRALLGFTTEDKTIVRDMLIDHLSV